MIVQAGEEEGVYIAEFDLNQLREYRRKSIGGNAYRKPRSYGILTSIEVKDPFVRKDSRR